ncbi:MAG TPA: DUF1015 domain-containing protein [Terriglobales bacterium]|nr:DUF1015 domain-containing protein [Terriglobales bacterium]
MAIISPFQAWRYDPKRVPVQLAVTQPYDKITPAMQERYYQASPYNLVRIILGKRLPGDGDAENVYTRAAASFQNWRQTAVLRQDPEPSIYRYSQTFSIPGDAPGSGQKAERRGFIALGRIEDYSAGVVFRHEQTLAKPKADRLDLLRANRAHFGQIFMLYSGAGKVDAMLDSAAALNKAPDIEVTDEYEVVHRVWKISDTSVIATVQEQMRDRKLIIADGHHRYETALTYRNERREAATKTHTPAPYDSVMMTFVDMDRSDTDRSDKDRPGLVILPTHRLVFGLPSFSPSQFEAEARKFFNVQEVDAAIDSARATAILRHAGLAGTALLAVTAQRSFLLDSPNAIGTSPFGGFSLRQQALDVVQLHKGLLEGVLKISEEAIRNQENVSYCREATEALTQVRSGKVQVAFLMNPVRIEQVRDIAFAGEVLPQKSTDFYPKLLSGLTIYALE